jgi:hypothetical protein
MPGLQREGGGDDPDADRAAVRREQEGDGEDRGDPGKPIKWIHSPSPSPDHALLAAAPPSSSRSSASSIRSATIS